MSFDATPRRDLVSIIEAQEAIIARQEKQIQQLADDVTYWIEQNARNARRANRLERKLLAENVREISA